MSDCKETLIETEIVTEILEECCPGLPGEGVPKGGLTDQFLAKKSNADYDTEWRYGGGGGGAVVSVNGKQGVVILDKTDIGLSNVDNTSDANKPVSIAQQAALNLKIDLTEKGVALGVVPLDSGAKIDISYIPDSLIGQVKYQGTWNATTNTPTLTNGGGGSGSKGFYYVVNVDGSTSLDGISDWKVGDWVISNGSAWQKVDNTDAVSSVFGRVGAIVANSGDYNTSQVTENTNLYFTQARAIASPLTGFVSGAGTVLATDTILQAIQKINGNIAAIPSYTFLTGLNNNSGVITANLSTGVVGGQSAIGGVNSGDNLTLSSTSNATKGKILFGSSSYDEVNNYLGLLTSAPNAVLDMVVAGIGNASPIDSQSIMLENPTVSTSSTLVQDSPAVFWRGNGWKSNATAGSQPVDFRMYMDAESGTTQAAGALRIQSRVNNGSWANRYRFGDTGALNIVNSTNTVPASNPQNIAALTLSSDAFSGVMAANVFANGGGEIQGYNNSGLSFGQIALQRQGGTLQIGSTNNGAKLNLFGDTLTGATATSLLDSGQTWNTTGSPTALKLNITNTASGASALLADIQIGGSPLFRIDKVGRVGVGGVTAPAAWMHLTAGTSTIAPFIMNAGTLLGTPAAGALEFNGTNLFFTRISARECVITQSAVTSETLVSDTSVTVNLNGTTYKLLARA